MIYHISYLFSVASAVKPSRSERVVNHVYLPASLLVQLDKEMFEVNIGGGKLESVKSNTESSSGVSGGGKLVKSGKIKK